MRGRLTDLAGARATGQTAGSGRAPLTKRGRARERGTARLGTNAMAVRAWTRTTLRLGGVVRSGCVRVEREWERERDWLGLTRVDLPCELESTLSGQLSVERREGFRWGFGKCLAEVLAKVWDIVWVLGGR